MVWIFLIRPAIIFQFCLRFKLGLKLLPLCSASLPALGCETADSSPLPILFVWIVNHPERTRFLDLCQHISEGSALQEAQKVLIR
ncbi:MAG TPA: hypothetical protein VMT73_05590, partial [Anaerolineales bacterium]|nr:hypothetical protein [Anaerolineales bacterium]